MARTAAAKAWADGLEADAYLILRNAWREQWTVRARCSCGRILDRWKVEPTYWDVDWSAVGDDDPQPEPSGFQLTDAQVTSGPYKVGPVDGDRATIASYQSWGQHEMEETGVEGRPRYRYQCGRHGAGCQRTPTVLLTTRERMFLQAFLAGERDVTLP